MHGCHRGVYRSPGRDPGTPDPSTNGRGAGTANCDRG